VALTSFTALILVAKRASEQGRFTNMRRRQASGLPSTAVGERALGMTEKTTNEREKHV
jgi:hypothetical protein